MIQKIITTQQCFIMTLSYDNIEMGQDLTNIDHYKNNPYNIGPYIIFNM